MSRTPLVLALLGVAFSWQAAPAGPPGAPSGKMVRDDAPRLRDEVLRLEKEVQRDNSDPRAADELDMARARLAAAEGRMGEARAAWGDIIDSRESSLKRWQRGDCSPLELTIIRGAVAVARCGLADVEGDRAELARELPKVIAGYEATLRLRDELRKVKAIEPEETDEERTIRKELRQLRRRLDAIRRR